MKLFLLLSVLFSFQTLFANELKDLTYTVDGEDLPFVKQYFDKLKELGEEDVVLESADNIEYKSSLYEGLKIKIDGVVAGTKIEQTFTYVEILEGLFKLVFIEGKNCVKGTVLREGEWVQDWVCDEMFFPFRSEYGTLFLLADENVDIEVLSRDWGREIQVRVPSEEDSEEDEVASEEAEEVEEVILSLGDMMKVLNDFGFSWKAEDVVWTQPGTNKVFDALSIVVSGKVSDLVSLEQEFIYVKEEGETLKLKSIDGKRCEYIQRVEKEICTEIYSPTKQTPFPLVLKDSLSLSQESLLDMIFSQEEESSQDNEVDEASMAIFKCGSTAENFGNALRFYFEGSSLAINDVSNMRKVFSNFPKLVDPDRVLLAEADFIEYGLANKEPFLFDSLLEDALSEILKGADGKCDVFLPYILELKEKVLNKKLVFDEITLMFTNDSLNVAKLSPLQKEIYDEIIKAGDPLFQGDDKVFLDVAIGSFKRYVDSALSLLEDNELFLVSAVFKQDAYSGVLVPEQQQNVTSSFNESEEKRFFGVSFKTGALGSYIFSVHPDVQRVEPLDEIISINGVLVKGKSHTEVDGYFLDTSKPLDLVLKRKSEIINIRLEPKVLDIAKASYEITEEINESGKSFAKISLTSFPPGLAESLYQALLEFSLEKKITGYVLDLSSNRGGSADEAFKVASFFVKNRNLGFFSIGYRWSAAREPIGSNLDFFIDDEKPLLVLVNKDSQSAAEALAASLDALGRSYTVGEQTFGKQVAQDFKAINLSDGTSLLAYITTSEYLDAGGRSLNAKGLTPKLITSNEEKPFFDDGNSPARDYDIPASLVQLSYDFSDVEEKLDVLQDEILENGFSLDLLLNKL